MRRVVILLGPPGVGKGTVSKSLVKQLNCRWLSSGELLRKVERSGSKLGAQIAQFIDKGRLVPDELITRLVESKLATFPSDCCLLLDGFPRTLAQAESLDQWLSRNDGEVTQVVELYCDEEVLVQRIHKRSREEGRTDDGEETFRHRLRLFEAQTAPLIQLYETQHKLVRVDATGSPNEVLRRTQLCIQKSLANSAASHKKEAG